MYHSAQVVSKSTEADTVYIEKLRASLNDMAAAKEEAIRSENYMLADAMKQKMAVLAVQLSSMEYQFNADIIINSITSWQMGLAKAISKKLEDVKSFVQDCNSGAFPLKDSCHVNFLTFIDVVPSNYYDSLLRSLLLVMPQDIPGVQKSPYGWESFARRIPKLSNLHPDSVEFLKSVLVLSILDIIVEFSSRFTAEVIKKETQSLFVKHVFAYMRAASSRRISMEHEAKIFEKITARWSVITGDISRVGPSEILRNVFSVLDVTLKRPAEEVVLTLATVRYTFVSATFETAPDIIRLVRELVNYFDRNKKNVVRLSVLQCLEKIVSPLDFSRKEKLESWEGGLSREIMDLYKVVHKWGNASDDLKGASARVCVAILVNSPYEFFQPTVNTFLSDLLGKSRTKAYVYHVILQLLRGRWFSDTKENALSRLRGTYSPIESYAFLTRPVDQEPVQVVTERVKYIADQLFVRKKERVATENLDVVFEILMQMAAQSLDVTLKLISFFVNNRTLENADMCYIGVRTIRSIIDPDAGFLANASCSVLDPKFAEIVNSIPYEFDASLVSLIQFCDSVSGISVLGISGLLVEPGAVSNSSNLEGEVQKPYSKMGGPKAQAWGTAMSGKVQDMYARGDADLVAMLSESMETISMRNSVNPGSPGDFGNIGLTREPSKRLKPVITSDAIKEKNNEVKAALLAWYEKCGSPKANVEKFAFSSTLEASSTAAAPPTPIDRTGKERGDLVVVLMLFREVIRTIPFIPQPDLVIGKLFIGPYLLHSYIELARETSIALEKTFVKYPEFRIDIVRAILDLIKNTSLSDISYATIMLHLTYLIGNWASDFQKHVGTMDPEKIQRLSCKLDACLLIMLARPNPRIRHASLQALAEFYTISEAVSPHLNEPGFLPLQAILNQRGDFLSRNAIFSFMERDLLGHKLSPNVYAMIPLLEFQVVAASDYSLLFKFYLGELARQFGLSGRPKALRHCAKFLTSLAVPYMTSVTTVDNEFVITYSNYMVLLMALGGVPMVSEDGYSLESYSSAEHLLFNNFRHFLAPILNSDNQWEIRAIVQASYFMHISLYQLYIVHLWQWYAETRQNSLEHLNPRMLDNIMYAIRSLCQNRDFEIIAREPSVFQSSIIEIIVDFIRMSQTSLQDADFLKDGPLLRIKLAINFCTVVSRLAYAIFTAHRFILEEQEVYIDGVSRPSMFLDISFPGLGWDSTPKLAVIHLLKEITTAAEDAFGQNSIAKVAFYRTRLLDKIGLAVENILVLGDVFEGDALPTDILQWLSRLQRSGYNVFPPQILCNYENALGTVLAHSYNKAGRDSGFLSAIMNQLLPRPVSTLAFASNFVEEETIDFALAVTSSKNTLIYPETDKATLGKIVQNIGSLVFFGIYNLLNSEKSIRCRSYRFLREIILKFGGSPEIVAEVDRFSIKLPTKSGEPLRKIAVRCSQIAAGLFLMDAPSFFWEAVRCSRTVQKSSEELLLVPSQQLILEIITPWCKVVNFADMNEDLVFAEFFRYLMDATFYKPKHFEEVRTCWKIISSSPEFGRGNSEILAEMLIHVRGKLENFSENVYNLLYELFQAHHITVAECCAHYLDARSFRPSQDSSQAAPLRQKTKKIVVEYVSVLHIALTGGQFDNSKENAALAKASGAAIMDLFVQDFAVLRRYLPVTLSYALLHLPDRLDESNVIVSLLLSLIDGCWGVRQGSEENETQVQLLLELKQYLKIRPTEEISSKFKIPIVDLISLVFGIFAIEIPSLVSLVAFEVVCWGHESHVSPTVSRKALDIYNCMVGLYPEFLTENLQSFSSRVADQVGIIQRLDTGKESKDASEAKTILYSLLRLHGNLMNLESFEMDERCLLFWESACMLSLPQNIIPDIWTLCLENCVKFLKTYPPENVKLSHHFEPIRSIVGGIQPLLLQGLFISSAKIQEMCFDFLVTSWNTLPSNVVDGAPTGLFYTCLFSVLWIFSKLEDFTTGVESTAVKGVASQLQQYLASKSPLEFAGMIKSLQSVIELSKEDGGPDVVGHLLEKCAANLSQVYFPEFITNAVEFCAHFVQHENASYSRTSLKIVQVFWSLAQRSPKTSGTFKALLRKLVFYEDRRDDVMEVYSFILSESADSDEAIKEVDLTSYGKVEILEPTTFVSGSTETVVTALRSLR